MTDKPGMKDVNLPNLTGDIDLMARARRRRQPL